MIREAPAGPPLRGTSDRLGPDASREPLLDIANIQGNILAGFNKDYQTFLFLRIKHPAHARDWLKNLVPYVATTSEVLAFNRLFKDIRRRRGADTRTVQATWLNVALSCEGIRKITEAAGNLAKAASRFRKFKGVPAEALSGDLFKDRAFRQGLAKRAVRKLNDPEQGEGNPENWVFGGKDNEADIVVIIAGDARDDLDAEVARLEGTIYSGRTDHGSALSGVEVIYKQQGATLPAPLTGHEHFGFLDSISQPGIRGRISPEPRDVLTPRQNPKNWDQGKPGQDLLWPGEFVFGYPGQIQDSEQEDGIVKPGKDPLGSGKNVAGPVWARDGSFLVIRRLRQDVPGFAAFLAQEAEKAKTTPEILGAKLVGRWKSGAPLMRAPEQDNAELSFDDCANNNFEFQEASEPIPAVSDQATCAVESSLCADHKHPKSHGDKTGHVCPFAAHIRRTYPRDDVGSLKYRADGARTVEVNETTTQTHRLLRRGIPYGAPYFEPQDPDRQRDQGDRGLMFVAYQTSIVDQFEFVQSAYANNPDFKHNLEHGEAKSGMDLIIGQAKRGRKRSCRILIKEKEHTIETTENFVIPTGGGYFFSPSIDALCLLTGSNPEHGREADASEQVRDNNV